MHSTLTLMLIGIVVATVAVFGFIGLKFAVVGLVMLCVLSLAR